MCVYAHQIKTDVYNYNRERKKGRKKTNDVEGMRNGMKKRNRKKMRNGDDEKITFKREQQKSSYISMMIASRDHYTLY